MFSKLSLRRLNGCKIISETSKFNVGYLWNSLLRTGMFIEIPKKAGKRLVIVKRTILGVVYQKSVVSRPGL